MMAPTLTRLVALWTCQHCAGEGRLATRRTYSFLGVERIETSTLKCEECQGSGVKADAAAQLGLVSKPGPQPHA